MEQCIITILSIEELQAIIQEAIQEVLIEYLAQVEKSREEEAPLMTIAELAEYLKVSAPTIWHWRKVGKLPYMKLGRKVYFNKNEVDKVLLTSVKRGRNAG